MALKETTIDLIELLEVIKDDLTKAVDGNQAAALRARTGTVRLEKLAKVFRKESIEDQKVNQ